MPKPVVALVGRPNVGKSTLFNRLAGEPLAIVDNVPGTTRDRLFSEAEWNGVTFNIVDTGGIDPSVGGKEPLSIGSADYIAQIRSQAELAIREADAVLFLTDAGSGVTPADQEVAQILRRNQGKRGGEPWPPILLVANKADSSGLRAQAAQFYELGLGEPYPISSIHGTGTGDLLDALVALFKDLPEEEEDEFRQDRHRGQTERRQVQLAERPGRRGARHRRPHRRHDAGRHRHPLYLRRMPVTLIDTAGIRRRGRVEPGVEKYSVIRSMRAIERADVALLIIDATSGINAQDAHIAGYILDAWKSTVVLVNKWDTGREGHLHHAELHQPHPPGAQFRRLCAPAVHLGQDRPARRSSDADGFARAGRTPGAPDHFHVQSHPAGSPGRASGALARRTVPCASIMAPRCAATRPPFCCTSTIRSWAISLTCVFWRTAFARNTDSWAPPSA